MAERRTAGKGEGKRGTTVGRLAKHPLAPMGVAAVTTLADPTADPFPKSIFLILCWLWLTVDLRSYFWSREGWSARRRSIAFCTSVQGAAIVCLFVMGWFANSHLHYVEDSVWDGLSASAVLPPDGDPWYTSFAVRSSGPAIIGKHQIDCETDLVVGTATMIGGITSFAISPDATIQPSGQDADDCLGNGILTVAAVRCLDIRVRISYSLDSVPQIEKVKVFRFVASQVRGQFRWEERSPEEEGYCSAYLTPEQKGRLEAHEAHQE